MRAYRMGDTVRTTKGATMRDHTTGEGIRMNDAALAAFREIAEAMQTEPTDWQWTGVHMSQRMFGITEKRAKAYAERHGGTASRMAQGSYWTRGAK